MNFLLSLTNFTLQKILISLSAFSIFLQSVDKNEIFLMFSALL